MKAVIDISHSQANVRFGPMVDNGVDGVIIRAGIGDHFDDRFETYIAAAQAAGLHTGVYWFCNPKQGTPDGAAHMLASAHNRHACTLPPMADCERFTEEAGKKPALKGRDYAAWLRTFLDVVEAKARRPFIYSNSAFWDPHVRDSTFGDYDIIVARYPIYPPPEIVKDKAALDAWMRNQPKVPLDAQQWGSWIMNQTKHRPVPPAGWSTWSGWQFSAGFNCNGTRYGASSRDLDLNIIHDDVWERWTGSAASRTAPLNVSQRHEVTPIPIARPQPDLQAPGEEMFLIKTVNDPAVYLVVPAPNLPERRFRVHLTPDDFNGGLGTAYGPICTVDDTTAFGRLVSAPTQPK